MSATSGNYYKSIIASCIGNMLEWYEYTLYAYFSSVISNLFFPVGDRHIGMILTFATFAVGLLARPIGGIVFGHVGDRISRKKMLVITMLLMSIPTMCIGLLPTYAQIGIAAPLILIVIRIVQGFALGGELGASSVYLYELAPEHKRNFLGTLPITSVGVGVIFSACTIYAVEHFFSEAEIYSYAWRVPFFISIIGSMIGLYMRSNTIETWDFELAKQNNKLVQKPFIEMLKSYKGLMLYFMTIFITTQTAFFVIVIFGKTMMIDFMHYDAQTASLFSIATLISYTILTFICGYLADKISLIRIVFFGVLGIFIMVIPFIDALSNFADPKIILLYSVLLGGLIGSAEGVLNPMIASSFPVEIRATSVAFCWNITAIIFGGSAPIISMWLMKHFNTPHVIGYYLMFVSSITMLSIVLRSMKKKGRPLNWSV